MCLAALVAVFAFQGSPWTIASNAWRSFSAPPPAVSDLNDRYFSFSGSGRAEQWSVALDAWREQPWLGIGAGGYERYWLEHRAVGSKIRDAHSLYIEQLAEVGPVGLAFLLTALGVPVYAAFRSRRRPLVPAAFGAYVAYLVHAGIDWDWEMPVVTLAGLACGIAVVAEARARAPRRLPSLRTRLSSLLGPISGEGRT
jgi:O-antigen ligase